jgi:hypothetical protein
MIDLTTETPLPLADACRLIPPGRNGKRTHLSTLVRWITSGALAPGGGRIRLEGVRLGGRWMTSREALQRFADRLTPRLDAEPDETPRTPRQRNQAAERAGQELEKLGI